MVVTDPSIDPITGLPVLNPSGPVQQIPLGQEVFPYADLNATAQPTRGPIYGDDIIPTSGLVTAPDVQMKPRSIQSTTTRELRTREAVFQNLGAAIPDGTTAPVDVNVVSGGGGGGGIGYATLDMQHFSFSSGDDASQDIAMLNIRRNWHYLYGVSGSIALESTAPPAVQGHSITVALGNSSAQPLIPLWTYNFLAVMADPFFLPQYAQAETSFTVPINIWTSLDDTGVWWFTLNQQHELRSVKAHWAFTFLVGT